MRICTFLAAICLAAPAHGHGPDGHSTECPHVIIETVADAPFYDGSKHLEFAGVLYIGVPFPSESMPAYNEDQNGPRSQALQMIEHLLTQLEVEYQLTTQAVPYEVYCPERQDTDWYGAWSSAEACVGGRAEIHHATFAPSDVFFDQRAEIIADAEVRLVEIHEYLGGSLPLECTPIG